MKKVVCILVLSLAAISIAYGQVAELPPAGTTPTSGAEVAPLVVVEPAVAQPPEAAPPPIHSTSGIRRVLGPAPDAGAGMVEAVSFTRPGVGGFGMTTATPWAAIGGQGAVTFALFDPEKGVRYGPFPLQTGVPIAVGGAKYVLEVVGLAPPEEDARTPEQLNLENELRKAIIPELALEGTSLMEAVNLLAEQSGTNIVVTEVLQKADFSVTLRLRNIPLYDAIRYVTEVIGVGFRVDDHAVVITHEMPPPRIPIPPLPRNQR